MEHVNNDMDDLFKQAGELYPLKTSESDWGGVLGKLRDEISGEKGIPNAAPVRSRSNVRRWLLLLLVPALIYSLVYFNGPHNKANNVQPVSKSRDLSLTKDNADDNKISSSPGQKTNNKTTVKNESLINSPTGITSTIPVSTGVTRHDEKTGRVSAQKTPQDNHVNRNRLLSSGQTGFADQSPSIQTQNITEAGSFPEPVGKSVSISAEGLNETPSVYGMLFPPLVQKNVTLNSETAGTLAKTNTKKAGSQKGIYAVVLGGPDWSAVKMQSTEQAGYSLGALIGFRFNKRLSVETGLLWDKKNYYSDGQYFDKTKLKDFPANVNILNVDGYCNMFEIPLNLRYDFATTNNHGFFVEAGLSSYLMKKEYYNYELSRNYGNAWAKDSTYLNASKNLFSILQISGGYEYSIGKNTSILIEPYVKIPLGGIGIGNMPISSMGIYFGISHLFH